VRDAALRALRWLADHWRLVAVALVAVVGAVLGLVVGQRREPGAVAAQVRSLRAGRAAADEAARAGTERAVEALEEAHRETIASFDEGQAKRLRALRRDPRALGAWLERLGKG
jgi:hypothetical protein